MYKEQYQQKILKAISQNQLNGSWINSNSAEWEHHFSESYSTINDLLHAESIQENSLLKIVSIIKLEDWDNAEEFLQLQFKKYLELLFT